MRSVNFSSGMPFAGNPIATGPMQNSFFSQSSAVLQKDAYVKVSKPLFGEDEESNDGGGASGEGTNGKTPFNWKNYIGLTVPGVLVIAVGYCGYLLITNDSSSSADSPKPAASELVEIGEMRGLPVKVPKSLLESLDKSDVQALCREALENWNVPKGQEIKPGSKFTCSDGRGGNFTITAVPPTEIPGTK